MRWSVALALGAILAAAVACGGDADGGAGAPDEGLWPCYSGTCDDATGPGHDAGPGRDTASGRDAATPPDAGTPPGEDAVAGEDVHHNPFPECIGAGCDDPPDLPDVEVDPPEEVWFSYMPTSGEPVVKPINVYNAGSADLFVTGVGLVSGSPPDYSVTSKPDPSVPVRPGAMVTVEVTFRETTLNPPEGILNIQTNDPDEPETWIRLKAQPKGDVPTPEPCIQVSPTVLDFGSLERGQIGTKTFTITSCGTAALSVSEIRRGSVFFIPTSDEFQLGAPVQTGAIPQGTSVVQTVTFEAGLAGQKVGFFEVINNDPATPSVRVDVRGVSTAPPPETQGLHLQLEWDSNNCDVDMHLLNPQGTFFQAPNDCYYANMAPNWGTANDFTDDPFLDVDNVWGLGPENINLQAPQPGTYKLMIHFYSDSYQGSPSTDTDATVRVYFYGVLAGTFGPTYLAGTGKVWDVCTIDWPSQTITPLGAVYDR